MNATEARQRSASAALNVEVEQRLAAVLTRIREAADTGVYRVVVSGERLHPHVVTRLLSLGYEESYNATTCVHTLSWALFTGQPGPTGVPAEPTEYVIRRTTRASATWADGVPRKGEPDEIYVDWWLGGVCFTNELTPQCTRLTFDLARSICALMNKYRHTNEVYHVWGSVNGVATGCTTPGGVT
jgi:hypothetical protein